MQWHIHYNQYQHIITHTLQGTNISPTKALLSRWFSFSHGGICDRFLEGIFPVYLHFHVLLSHWGMEDVTPPKAGCDESPGELGGWDWWLILGSLIFTECCWNDVFGTIVPVQYNYIYIYDICIYWNVQTYVVWTQWISTLSNDMKFAHEHVKTSKHPLPEYTKHVGAWGEKMTLRQQKNKYGIQADYPLVNKHSWLEHVRFFNTSHISKDKSNVSFSRQLC